MLKREQPATLLAMSFKKSCLITVLLVLLFVICGGGQNRQRTSVQQRGRLVVAMDIDMPGYFVLEGESYGYSYDLLKAYADYLGVELQVIAGKNTTRCRAMISSGEVDMMATLTNNAEVDEYGNTVPIYNTSYVMLAPRARAAEIRAGSGFDPVASLREARLLVSSGFRGSETYRELLDSLHHTRIFVSTRSSFELMELLAAGEYDYLICEQSEAQLGCSMVRQVEQVYRFREQISLSTVVSPRARELKTDFELWLDHFRNGEEYAVLNDLYFEKGIVYRVLYGGGRPAGGISPYDKMIKRICEDEGYDWRLISAIVYSESRFDPHVVSSRGARGLMQVMPGVASQFAVDGDIMDPEHNVLLGLKVLGKIKKSLAFAPETPQVERMKIILACYNGGIGHVLDARNLARKYGANPDAWEDVSRFLTLKSAPEYAGDETIKHGAFDGSQTLAFVAQVFNKYHAYCSRVNR